MARPRKKREPVAESPAAITPRARATAPRATAPKPTITGPGISGAGTPVPVPVPVPTPSPTPARLAAPVAFGPENPQVITPYHGLSGAGDFPGGGPHSGAGGHGPVRYEPPCEPPPPCGAPLRVIHVGQSMVRAGIEQWLIGLARFLDPGRVKLVRCVATVPEHIDPGVVAEIEALGVPVEVGWRDTVRKAAGECDVLLCWGPDVLGEWLADCRPPLCVMVAHGEGPWTRRIIDGCRPSIDHVVAVSRRVWEHNCRDIPSSVIPNGVDASHLARTMARDEIRRRLGFGPDDFVLGYVGRFSPEKRPHVVIEAVARLPHRFKALLVGWGSLQGELMDLANRSIPGRYSFTAADGPVGDVFNAMDALCLVSEEEGFGLVILEGMMSERPVIATMVGCVPELIVDRVNGLVVPGTANSVRDAALLLQRHPHWARALALEARATAEETGHARLMARRYEDLLLRLWAEKYPAAGGG